MSKFNINEISSDSLLSYGSQRIEKSNMEGDCEAAALAARSWQFKSKREGAQKYRVSSNLPLSDKNNQAAYATTYLSGSSIDSEFDNEVVYASTEKRKDSYSEISLVDEIRKSFPSTRSRFDHWSPLIRSGNGVITKKPNRVKPLRYEEVFTNFSLISSDNVEFCEELPVASQDSEFRNMFKNSIRLAKEKRFRESLVSLNACFNFKPDGLNRSVLLFNRSMVLCNIHGRAKLQNSLDDMNEAIRLNPMNESFLHCRSIQYRLMGDYINASKDCRLIERIREEKEQCSVLNKRLKARMASVKHLTKDLDIFGSRIILKSKNGDDVIRELCQMKPEDRKAEHIELLCTFSSRFPFMKNLADNIQYILWRNFQYEAHCSNAIVQLKDNSLSFFAVLSGTLHVETIQSGLNSFQRMLGPNQYFSRACLSSNIWDSSCLISQTASEVLCLPYTVYKYSMKNLLMESSIERINFMNSTHVFDEWTDEQRRSLGILSETLEYLPDTVIVSEGQQAKHLYFIMTGIGSLTRMVEGIPVEFATVSRGDVIGEASVLNPINGVHEATMKSTTPMKLVRIETVNLNRRQAFDIMPLGKIDSKFTSRLQQLSQSTPSEKQISRQVREACEWERTRAKIMQEYNRMKGKT